MRQSGVSTILLALLGAASLYGQAPDPVPFIHQPLLPMSTAPGVGLGDPLTVNGTGFVSGAVVNWNGSGLATTFVNSGR